MSVPRCQVTGCGATENLNIHSRSQRKDGSFKIYYMCRMHNAQRLNKWKKTPKGRAYNIRRQRADQPVRKRARHAVAEALKAGKIKKVEFCRCGQPAVHAHHSDYSKPLDVVWLCSACHVAEHGRRSGVTK